MRSIDFIVDQAEIKQYIYGKIRNRQGNNKKYVAIVWLNWQNIDLV